MKVVWTLQALETAVQVAMTERSVCARLASGAMRCVGAEGFEVSSILDARDLGCARDHCCLTRTSGQPLCFGDPVPAGLVGDAEVSTVTPLRVVELLGR